MARHVARGKVLHLSQWTRLETKQNDACVLSMPDSSTFKTL